MDDNETQALMTPLLPQLFPHELQALLGALRRDRQMEMSRAKTHAEWADYHATNARLDARLLELLDPDSRSRLG